jgi:uncharacterized protein (TIGR03435 family)
VNARVRLALALAGSVVATTYAQQPAAPPLKFEVVSIKPTTNTLPSLMRVTPSGRFEWPNITLRELIRQAYSRFPFDPRQVVGGPSWINSERFHIIAMAERPLRPNADPADLVGMIRGLVEDRFRVKVHNEQRESNVYALVLNRSDRKTGSGLKQAPDQCGEAIKAFTQGRGQTARTGPPPCSFGGPPGKLIATGVTIAMFANVLSNTAGRPVVDRTGLTGSFDIELTYDPSSAATPPPGAPPGPPARDDTLPSLFTALQEQLGLKLESTRGPVDVLVIDSAERPAEN